jgi:ribulose 1,5-bisphosphate synthetase/thiazole synthase
MNSKTIFQMRNKSFSNMKKYFSSSFDYDVCVVGGGPAGIIKFIL